MSNHEKGSTLLTTVFFVGLLTAGGLTLVVFNQNTANYVSADVNRKQSHYVAQAGIEYAVKRSMNTGNWHWSSKISPFAADSIAIDVEDSTLIAALKDTLQIRVLGKSGKAGSRQTYRLRLANISNYAAYVAGDINTKVTIRDSNGTPNPSRALEYAPEMPDMNTDLLKSIAIYQGHYFVGDLSVSTHYPLHPDSGFFHVRPNGTVSDTPNVVYVNGNLEVKNGGQIAGIIVVTGDVSLKNSQRLNGVLYLPNPVSVIQDVDLHNRESIYGAVIGSANVTGLGNADMISIFYRASYVSLFYGYFSNSGSPFVTFYRNWREY